MLRARFDELLPQTVIATLDRRRGVVEHVARALGAQLVTFTAEELARVPGTSVVSPRAATVIGTASVAEAAALAAAGEGARLLLPRQSASRCTYALAEGG